MARQVTQQKPVIAMKVGRFEAGQKAAASHTGALAASDTAFDAAFEKAGILRADSAEQMFDWARVLEAYPLFRSRLAVATAGQNSSTSGDRTASPSSPMPADRESSRRMRWRRMGCRLQNYRNETTRSLVCACCPPAANVFNPVDMLASASPETYAASLKILLDDDTCGWRDGHSASAAHVQGGGSGVRNWSMSPYGARRQAARLHKQKTCHRCPVGIGPHQGGAGGAPERRGSRNLSFSGTGGIGIGCIGQRTELLDHGRWTIGPYRSIVHGPWSAPMIFSNQYSIPTASVHLARSVEEAERSWE